MSVAICVPYRPRNDHDAKLWDWARRRWEALFPDWPVHVADSGHEPFNRSASRNAAAAQCPDAQVLVFANSDTVYETRNDVHAAIDVCRNGGWTLPHHYVETSDKYTAALLRMDPTCELPDPLSSYDRQLFRSVAGPQVMIREWWEDCGQWDEAYKSWGYEDDSLRIVLSGLHTEPTYVGQAVHLYHPRTRAEWPQSNRHNKIRRDRLYRRAASQGPAAIRRMLATRD